MTEAEIYEFDLNGYIVYRDFLSADEVKKMNDVLDAEFKKQNTEDTHSFSFLSLDP